MPISSVKPADATPLVTRWSEPLLYLARAGVRARR